MKKVLLVLLMLISCLSFGQNIVTSPSGDQVISGPYSLSMSDPSAIFKLPQGYICMGCSVPTALLTLIHPGFSGVTLAGDIIEMHSNYGLGISIYAHADAGWRAPQITLYRSGGTQTSPTPVMAGQVIATIVGAAYDGNPADDVPGYAQPAIIDVVASEDFDSTHNGAYIDFQLTPAGGSRTMQHAFLFSTDTAKLYEPLSVPRLTVTNSHAPISSSATCTQGQIEWDSNFTYVCIAANTWKRSALVTW